MYTINQKITWTSDEYASTPANVRIELSEEDMNRLKHLIELAKDEKIRIEMPLDRLSITFYDDLDEDEEEDEDYSDNWIGGSSVECIRISNDGDLMFRCFVDEDVLIQTEFFDMEDITGEEN